MGGEKILLQTAFKILSAFFQMIWFRENWYEEFLRQLNEGLSLCQAAAFESRADGRFVAINCYRKTRDIARISRGGFLIISACLAPGKILKPCSQI